MVQMFNETNGIQMNVYDIVSMLLKHFYLLIYMSRLKKIYQILKDWMISLMCFSASIY